VAEFNVDRLPPVEAAWLASGREAAPRVGERTPPRRVQAAPESGEATADEEGAGGNADDADDTGDTDDEEKAKFDELA
jgi:hypothetical protein